ncbi:RNA polymerase sigma factor [Methylopila sp. 73B]|uniref:RNA polymerase sigma factor n=1 Tax=Methylopila sp. 73B TaxID=1120792 RepID=UPI0003701AC4|nr:RNA polymerase sigma factor [Methylopila sp. 73B]
MSSHYLTKLGEAYLRLRPRLEIVARARTRDHDVAEDLVQETWLRLQNAERSKPVAYPTTFIQRILDRVIIDHERKRRRRSAIDAELAATLWERSDDISPERLALDRDALASVREALHALPERTRRIFLRNRIDGVSHRRIAEEFGVTEETVYYHVRRAIERLAEMRDQRSQP